MPHLWIRFTLTALVAFAAGALTQRTFVQHGSGVPLAPPLTRAGWPDIDSLQVIERATAAYRSEVLGSEALRVVSFQQDRLGYYVGLTPEEAGLGGGADVRVSHAGHACVVTLSQ